MKGGNGGECGVNVEERSVFVCGASAGWRNKKVKSVTIIAHNSKIMMMHTSKKTKT